MWVISDNTWLVFETVVQLDDHSMIQMSSLTFLVVSVSHQASGQETRSWPWTVPLYPDWTWIWCRVSSATRSSSCCSGETSHVTPRSPLTPLTPLTPASRRRLLLPASRPGPQVRQTSFCFITCFPISSLWFWQFLHLNQVRIVKNIVIYLVWEYFCIQHRVHTTTLFNVFVFRVYYNRMYCWSHSFFVSRRRRPTSCFWRCFDEDVWAGEVHVWTCHLENVVLERTHMLIEASDQKKMKYF